MIRYALPFLIACGPPNDERALRVIEEGLTSVPPEDTCLIEPAIMCCDDITVVRLNDAPAHFDVAENDLGGAGLEESVNYLEETGVIAYTSSCPGAASALKTVDLRIDEEGVATLTYEIIEDEGDGETDPVRPYSVALITRIPSEITDIRYEIALTEE